MPILLRITTVPISLHKLIKGQARYMVSKGFEVHLASADGIEVLEVVKTERVTHHIVNYTREITPIKDLISLWQTIKLIKKINPQIVHTHTPKAGLIGMMAAWYCRVPYRLHTIAGLPLLEITGLKRLLLNKMEQLTSFCATSILPNSFELKKIMEVNNLAPRYKLKVIGNGSSNGINTSYFSPALHYHRDELKKELKIKKNDTVFCFVGRLVKDKGINELIEVFSRIRQSQSNVKLLLVGDMEKQLDPLFPETVEKIGVIPEIISVGWQDDIRPYLVVSDIFVFPSYREGFPNVVMQAGAMGLPSIVTNINGSNEIIKDGVNGRIIPVKDVALLQDAMIEMLIDNTQKIEMATKAREIIVQKYEQSYVWEELLKEYNTLLDGRD